MAQPAVLHTTTLPTPLRIAQVAGLTSTAFLAGKTFAQTVTATPALLLAPPALLTKQWKKMFDADKLLAPVIVTFATGVFGWIAYRDARPTLARNLNATAAVLLATTIPYSLVFLEPLTQKLEAHARNSAATSTSTTAYDTSDDVQAREEQTVHYLLDRWATFNLGRGVLAGVAAVCAVWAGVGGIRVVGVDVLGSA